MAVRIKDIAQRANVSEATVSLALNNHPLVNVETAKRIKLLAKEMGYMPNPYARRLILKRSGTIGIVVPDIENVFYASFVHHMNLFCRQTEYSLSIYISLNDPKMEERIIDDLIAAQVEGVLFIPINVPEGNNTNIEKLEEAGISVVCATTAFGALPFVMSDLENGMFLLVSHMLNAGRSKIAYVSGPQNVYALDIREKGLRNALQKSSIPPERIPYYFMDAVTYSCACEAAERILAEHPGEIDCIICVNDIMALGVINTLKQKSIKIPEAICVAGFDDSIFSVTSPVPITTVRQNISEIAEKSLHKLLAMIGKESNAEPCNKVIPVELIVRESSSKQ